MDKKKPLLRIEGTISDLKISHRKEHVLVDASFEKKAKFGTMLSLLLGVFAYPGMATADYKQWVDRFTCTIDDAEYGGMFSYADFNEGDQVVCIIQDSYPRAQIVSMIREHDRRIWTPPYINMGFSAYKEKIIKRLKVFYPIAFILIFVGVFIASNYQFIPPLIAALLLPTIFSLGYVYLDWTDIGRRTKTADLIFTAFGFDQPSSKVLSCTTKNNPSPVDDDDCYFGAYEY